MAPICTVATSQEYKDLMQPILTKVTGQELRKGVLQCPETHPRSQLSPLDRSFLDFLVAGFLWPKRLLKSSTEQQLIKLPPLHPTARLIQDQMLALPPFTTMAPETLLHLAVGVVIPSWLAGTEEACHIARAAERTFGRMIRLESPPSSAYTAAGYELCRISYEAFECTGPGRIMTLEYDGNLAVASILQTPLSSWFANPVTFSARTGLTPQSMTEWINTFVDSQSPDRLILVGANADDPSFANALANSRAVSYLDDNFLLPPRQVLALGAAQAAKDGLELQIDDCGEPAECENLRRKADAISGTYRPPKPSTWPATGPRHLEL